MNPNQLRAHHIQVWDNPCDASKPTCVYEPATKTRIPLEMMGTFCTFPSYVPSNDELQSLPKIQLLSTNTLVPAKAVFYTHWLGEDAKMDVGYVSEAMTEYLSQLSKASAVRSINQQLICPISADYSDSFIGDAMGTLNAEMELKKGFCVGATYWVSSISNGAKADDVLFLTKDFSATRHSKVGKDTLKKIWCVSDKRAEETLRVTTCHCTRTSTNPLSKWYTDSRNPCRFRCLKGTWYTDIFFPEEKSLHGYTYCQIFYNKFYYYVVPLLKKLDAILALQEFATNIRVSEVLVHDGALAFSGYKSEIVKFLKNNHCKQRVNDTEKQKFSQAEGSICILTGQWKTTMIQKHLPLWIWDFVMNHEIEMLNRMWNPKTLRTPEEELTGNMPDISKYLDFGLYNCIWYWNVNKKSSRIGCWLGIATTRGEFMPYWILPHSIVPVVCSAVQRITKDEVDNQSSYHPALP